MSKPFASKPLRTAGKSAGLILAALSVAAVAVIVMMTALGGAHTRTARTLTGHAASQPSLAAAAISAPSAEQRNRVRATMGALPLAFEANQGQSDPQVKYMARGNGYTLFLTSDEAVFAVRSASGAGSGTKSSKTSTKFASAKARAAARSEEKSATIHMQFVGANSNAQVAAGSELPGVINYYIGNDPAKWHEGVKQYSAVTYRQVYPGVNLAYHGQQRQLEFDFIVGPGADAAPIALGFQGASRIATDASGNLVLSSNAGDVMLHKPVAYQDKDGKRQPVDVAFREKGTHEIAFALGAYDHERELVIDPALTYASYLGGNSDDEAFAIAVDGSGNIYVTGQSNSPTIGGKSRSGSSFDAFVSEFNPAGTGITYTSIIGATGGNCSGNAIAVDAAGDAFVAGSAPSGFATTGGVAQTGFGGGTTDGFVLKLAPSTGALSYSTYLGGSDDDVVNGIAVDASTPPNAYVAGETSSTDFPGTSGSTIQSTNGGTDDAFVTKLNGTASALVYSTYLGGSSGDLATGIALDGSDNAYITGITVSANFPTTSGVLQSSPGGNGDDDGFVAQIKADGSALVYSTYLGGSGTDDAYGIAVDAAGEAYVTGNTDSTNFPTVNAAQTALGGNSATNIFISKVNSGATALLFSTYYGGTLSDAGTAVALDVFGDAYVTGRATSSNYPVSNSFQNTLNGSSDAIVTEFSNTGFVVYSSYFGGPGTENGIGGADSATAIGGIAVDSSSNAYLAGDTSSASNVATANTYQTTYGGDPADAFVAKVAAAPADFSVAVLPTSASVASGQTTSAIAVTVSSVNASYGQAVTLSCASLPTHASCQFTSGSVTPSSTPGTSSVTISTNGSASARVLVPGANRHLQILAAVFAPLLGIAFVGGGISSRRKRLFGILLLALTLAGLMVLPACGGGSSSGGGGGGGGGTNTSPGTYNITVIGSAGGVTHSAPLTLTVQ